LGHNNAVRDVAISLDGKLAVSASKDKTIRVWDLQEYRSISVLEGHTATVQHIAISSDGKLVVSSSSEIILWDLITGMQLSQLERPANKNRPIPFFSTDNQSVFFTTVHKSLLIFDISKCTLRSAGRVSSRYTNAKVLLVGDSGVGKSGLAVRLTENKFEPTVSTDAHWATQLKLHHDANIDGIDREIWLWDFAGQADYRLMHQLFMDETALAVLVFNPQSENPFLGLGQWDRDLVRAARRKFSKLLVAGRCDRGRLMVSRETVDEFARQRGFASYLETSALTGDGCELLHDEIVNRIDWDTIPWTASPRIFKLLKDEILRLRDKGYVLLRMSELKQQLEMRLVGGTFLSVDIEGSESDKIDPPIENNSFTLEELRAVVGLLVGPGLVWKLEFGDILMLQPEWINKYAAAVIRSVRAHIGEIGVIDEAQVLSGELNYTMDVVRRESDGDEDAVKVEMQRLEPSVETIVLRAMHQMFVDHGLCVREELEGGGRQLIFPSYFRKELPTDPGHPPVLVNYHFDGHAEEIYATLVVQLWQTKAFENGDLWRYAADFKSVSGARLGLKMVRHENKNPEISVYFDQNVQDDTKVTFIKYVHEHLLQKAKNVVRLRAFVCPHCGHPVRDTELAREILNEEGSNAEIRCQQRKCDKLFSLWDVIEHKFASEEFQQRVRELEEKAKAAIDNESRELILEGHARVITGEAGQIYRGYTGSDHGIDGEIEFKNDAGQASGKRLYLQLKSGDSYLYRRKSDGAEIFQIKNQRWAAYWQEHAYPVILVIRTSDGEIRWMNVTEYLKEKSKMRKTPIKQIVFEGQPFTALNLQRLKDRILAVRD
jgi:small GTP-binding protein